MDVTLMGVDYSTSEPGQAVIWYRVENIGRGEGTFRSAPPIRDGNGEPLPTGSEILSRHGNAPCASETFGRGDSSICRYTYMVTAADRAEVKLPTGWVALASAEDIRQ